VAAGVVTAGAVAGVVVDVVALEQAVTVIMTTRAVIRVLMFGFIRLPPRFFDSLNTKSGGLRSRELTASISRPMLTLSIR
jgi:hypothetical protein